MTTTLTGIGALSPVGDDAASTFAALRANVSALGEHPYHELSAPDPEWDAPEALRAGMVPSIDPALEGPERLLALARGALQALVRDATLTRAELAATALFVALPEAGPDVAPWDLARSFVPELYARTGLERPVSVEVDQSGHVGALVMLGAAQRALAERRAARCVVLAVDSYLDEQRVLDWDQRRRRLRSTRNRDGFLPGECAVALLLEARDPDGRAAPGPRGEPASERPALAQLSAPGFGVEPHIIEGDRAPTGAGLTEAFRAVLGQSAATGSSLRVYADHNGESHRAFEWGLALARLSPRLDAIALAHPADCIGDVGAAAGALLIGMAAHGLGRAPAAGATALVSTASTNGWRGAMTVTGGAPR